jgi:hypothetical protein
MAKVVKKSDVVFKSVIFFAVLFFVLISANILSGITTLLTSHAVGLTGDANNDGKVDIVDIGILIDNYSRLPIINAGADINSDGRVDIIDIGLVIDNYGRTGTPGGGSGNATYDQISALVNSYAASHPGASGDVTVKTDAQLATDSAARQLVDVCGPGQRPVYPKLAIDYGAAGGDIPWVNPQAAALVYCVYIPTAQAGEHWSYNSSTGRVKADMYIKFPDQNPCKNMAGKDQVLGCMSSPGNVEILISAASLDDGHRAGLELSEASTELYYIMPNGTKVLLLLNL